MIIFDTQMKMEQVLSQHDKVSVSVSGGSDSDVLVDLFSKYEGDCEITYVFFDTGLEFDATKEHISYLEDRYNIKIHRKRTRGSLSGTLRDNGYPIISKQFSEMIGRLQNVNFDWNDIEHGYDYCIDKYDGCKGALKWLFALNPSIKCPRYLRNYLYENGLDFKVSNKCCKIVKKDVAKDWLLKSRATCNIVGVRQSESQMRSMIDSCYNGDIYYPILFWRDEDKERYCEENNIVHSDCYNEWGMTRTGCCGCPFANTFEEELELMDKYEPSKGVASRKLFGKSYEFQRDLSEWRSNNKPSEYPIK